MNGKTAVKECEFAQEIRYHVLPTEKDVIGHYFYHRNQLMCTRKEFLNQRPPFNICKESVLDVLDQEQCGPRVACQLMVENLWKLNEKSS